MPTLSQTTDITKKIILFGGGGILAIILIFFLARGGLALYSSFFPKPGPPPEAAFNALPDVIFPEKKFNDDFKYSLDTVTGSLGNFSDRAKVYKIIPSEPNLLSLQNTRALITNTSFNLNQKRLNETTYSWSEKVRTDKNITINIVSRDFHIASNFLNYSDLLGLRGANKDNATQSVVNFLTELELFPLDIDSSQTRADLLRIQDGELVAATSTQDSQFVRVDLYQKNVDNLPIMYPDPPHSTMNFVVGGQNTNEIMEANFYHQTISNESSGYPIISVNDAFSILKNNKAYIGSYFGTEKNIIIKKIYLAYYLGEQKQEYLMPIYVFEGKGGFTAYISAIKSEWINKTN